MSRRRGRAGTQQSAARIQQVIHPFPSVSEVQTVVHRKLRSTCNTGGNYDIFPRDIMDAWCVAATTTSAYQLACAVQIRSIKLWVMSSTAAGSGSAAITTYSGSSLPGLGSRSRVLTVNALGQNENGFGQLKAPKRLTGEALWAWSTAQTFSTYPLFSIDVGATARVVIELEYNAQINSGLAAGPTTVQGSLSGATVGVVYSRAINSASGTGWTLLDGQGLAAI